MASISFEFITLPGPWLKGERVQLKKRDGKIISCDAVKCVYTGTDAFDAWFRMQYLEPQEDIAAPEAA